MVWVTLSLAFAALSSPQPFAVQFEQAVSGRTVTVCIDGKYVETTFAGKLGFRDGNHEWQSVCADVRSPVASGQVYEVQNLSSALTGGNVARAGNIVAKYFYAAQTPDQCAGLQIAVWKALEDGTDEPDFLSGHFQVKASAAVMQYANEYYGAINTPGNAIYLRTGAQGARGGGGGGQGGSGQNQMSE